MSKYYLHLFSLIFIITSCGGGGGGSSEPPVPAPTVSISLSSSSIVLGESVTINWSSSNASSCTANGSWSGSKATSGTETLTPSGVGFFNYGISCSGSGGSRSSSVGLEVYRQTDGVSVDGYIRGAEIFIDKNNNFTVDVGDENSTTSDNDGKFTIKYDDGNLISLGGIDLDTGNPLDNFLINQNLSGYSEFKVITPVTSVASFLNDSTSINNVLGIDSSIDVFTFDPVANKGDGGINDYLYEKGNQLTILAFSLQNIINNINVTTETTQDYFKSIAEEIDLEYETTSQKVDIETSNFVLNVLNNITTAKEVTLDEANKDNTVTALSGLLPIIEVKPTQDLTNSIFNFATTTLQTDILTIADGTASEEVLTGYTTNIIEYIAEDQNIDSNEITPDITAISDTAQTNEDESVTINVLANDSFISSAPISVSVTNGSNGVTSIAESVPEQIVYIPNADFNGSDIFSYSIFQGDKTASADVSLTIEPVQDDPEINIASTISTPENTLEIVTISVSDVDDDELTLTISGTDANFFNLSTSNELSFKEQPDFEQKQQYLITLSLSDGNTTVTKDLTILVTNINDVAPVITSEPSFTINENQTNIGTVQASDVEGDVLSYSITGSEILISDAGVLTFVTPADYETKTSHTATVTVSDGELTDSQEITISITNINDVAPVISSSATFSAAENQTAIGAVEATDEEGDDLTYSVTGSEISISGTGILTFVTAPDYETKSTYISTVTVSDGDNQTSQEITINVTNVNDIAPVISSTATFSAAENQTAIGAVEATDEEGDDLTYSVTGSEIVISSTGILSFVSAPDYETKTTYTATVTVSDGVNSATQDITVNVTNLNDNIPVISSLASYSADENQTTVGTVEAADADGDQLTYSVSGSEIVISSTGILSFVSAPDYETKTTYTATVTVSDGVNSATQDITVNVTNLNDNSPVISSSASFAVDENQTAIGTVEAADADGDQLTYSVSGSEIEISNTGVLTFVAAPDYETKSSYTITVTVTDGEFSDTQDITVNISNVNDVAPIISSSATFNAAENQTSIGEVVASDAEGDELTYSVSGSEIVISSTGILSFVSAPDYETKTTYTATVTVSDGELNDNQEITISITNINDVAPVISTSATFSAAENQTAIGTVEASDEEGDDLTYSVTGSEIAISSTGILTFVSAPDYESKTTYTATVTVSDGELDDAQEVTINVVNVNDNSPIISSGSGFSVDENVLSIGNVTATDLDGDTLIYSVSGSELEISNTGALTFADSNGADFETQSSYIAVVTVTDGIFNAEQTIIITVQDTNDNFPVVTSSSFTPNENLVVIGTVTATDDDANSSLSYSISGSDTIRDGEAYLDIDSSTGEISVSSGRGVLDYETKSSYTFDVSVTDGTNVTTETVTVAVQNILEDVISYNFSISDGTLTQPPVLQATIVIDELTMAKKVYADLGQTQTSADVRCDGWGYENIEMTKVSATEWTLTEELSDEASELCRYYLNFYINPYDELSETAPPTDGIHLSSGNKRLLSNSLQYSMFYEPYPQYETSNLTTINNIRSDNTIDKTDDEQTLFFYINNVQDPGEYPGECTVDQYTVELNDGLGNVEILTTPYVATLDEDCATALTNNSSTDPDKVLYEYYFYSIEPLKKFYSYFYPPNKAFVSKYNDGKGGTSSRELLVTMGLISSSDPRKAYTWFEFDKAALPATISDDTTAYLYLEPSDESGAWVYNNSLPISLSNSLVGDDSDIYPPEIDAINISAYTTEDYPQRNFVKFDVDITNEASSGALTSVRDMWITYRGGPRCDNQVVAYVRDDLDGKIDTSINRLTATIPFLKNDEGTYEITGANINDHGYAEYNYYDIDYGSGSNNNASFIGQTFTVGDGTNITCPYFTNYYDIVSLEVNEGETFIGDFSAQGATDDPITYSIYADALVDSETGTGISNLVQISSDGVLSYINPLDYETDSHGRASDYKGGVQIRATSGLDPSLYRDLIVYVTLVNINDEAPVITSSANFSVNEGETEVGCIAVTDADGGNIPSPDGINCGNVDGLTYSITGDNLEIDSYGRIAFTSAPDYETKSSYTGTVSVSDGVNSTSQDIIISIVDVNDNSPIVTSNTSFTVSENQTGVGQITVSDGDANSSFTFAIVSDYEDGALFNVDSDGVITFKANANHETAGQYTIKVNISDGANTVAQIFTINLTDVCEFDFNDVVYSGLVLENQEASTRPLASDTINSKFFYEFNIDTTDDACNVPSDEIYSFSLTGDDASAFTLESSTGNDTDKNFIYLNKIFDHENPTDLNSDNVYNVTLNVTLDDFTESKNLSLTVSDGYEFGEIQSYTFDESASKFTINYLTDDLPPNTSKLRFSIRGPSFTGGSNFLTETIDYDPGSSLYTIELDAAAKVQEIWPDDPTIYGGYYSVYKIEALDADGNLVSDDTNADIVNSNIIGPRHLYYERADGQNFTKLESISGNIAFDKETNSAIFTALTNTSNNNLQLPDTEDYNRPTNSTYINVRLEVSNDIVRSRGYGTTLAYDGQTQLPDENGDTTHTLYFSPNLKSGTHKYRIYIRNRGLDGSSFYTYIYWSELQTLGYVTNPISYTNPNGTDDIEGPRLTAVNAQPKDGSMTCSWNPDDDSTPEGPGRLTLENISSQIQFTDDSMSSADGQTATDADARVYYRIFNTSGDSVDSLSLTDDGNSQVDGNTKTMTLVDSSERFNIDASDSAQFILKPVDLSIYDAAGQRTQYYDGDSYVDVKYPSVSSIFENIDLRDYCNFNLGNNAPVFDTASAFTINEGETDITTLSATDADGDSVSYGKTSDGDSSYFTVNQTTGALSFTNAPDYENPTDSDSDNDYSVTVTATDGFNTTSQAISVTVADISDSPPIFTSSGSFTANENQTAIGTVAASDPDGDTVAYSLSGTDADSLEINSSTGVLTFKIAPDYETKSSYSAEAIASDGTNASAQTISITIVNVNEFAPTFTSSSSFTVAENQTTGPTITASDADGDTLTYSISEGTDASSFEINSSSGAITFKTAPDYETKSSYQLSVRASDGTNIAAQDITVNIGNLNEHAPSLSLNSPVSVNEGSTAVTTATATDADGDETITFSIFDTGNSCTDNDLFSIGESTGVITFKSAPDYENPADSDADNEYALCIKASDNGGAAGTYFEETSRGGAATLIVNVQDLDDTSPVFTSSGTFSVDENQTSIGTVTATDEDSDILTYSISDGDTVLSINSSSGVLVFNSAPNYEVKPRYPPTGSSGEAYEVTVSDGTNSTTQEIVININDVNDAPTFTSDSSFSIEENTTSAIGSVVASDEDSDDITFSISGSEINISSDGLLTFETAPDYETKSSYSATVTISDGTDSATQDITVNVTDVNEAPAFTSNATFSAAENQTSIGTVSASDVEGDTLSYSISGSDLSINSSTGLLTFTSAPNYETTTTYTATVTVSDGTNTITQNITVNVTDVDEAPTFTSSATFSAAENQTAIGTATAIDPEGETTSYSLNDAAIQINESTGVLTFITAPDFETTNSYETTLTASDGTNTETQIITVTVTDVNDPPVISSDFPSTFTLSENYAAPSSTVQSTACSSSRNYLTCSNGTVNIGGTDTTSTFSDQDGDSLSITFSGTDQSYFSASAGNSIYLTNDADYETKNSYSANVVLSDGSDSVTKSFVLNINNVNDNAPVISSDATFSADENQTAIGQVIASDADEDTINYSISGSDITINSLGVIAFASAPDYETTTSYSATVTVSDGTNEATQSITVNINNLNDNRPVAPTSETFTVAENQTSVGTISATDADGSTLTYSIEASDDGSSFQIGSSSGVLTFISAPDYETKNQYTLRVIVSDGKQTDGTNVTVNVTDVNESPSFTSSATFSADENQTTIGTVVASDQDGDTLTYSISDGTSVLSINSSSGALSFQTAPNYEVKPRYPPSGDSGEAYVVTVSDGTNSTTQEIVINVNDVNDAPVATAAAYTMDLQPQSQTSGTLTLAGTDEDGDTLTYSIVSNGSYGTASLSGTTATYQTAADTQSAQTESFTFKVNDGTVDSSAATISISLMTDPLYQYQWHLNNTGQTNFATTGGTAGIDLNVDSVISSGITGDGIKIAIVDDGLEIAHEDLATNVISGSWDFVDSDNDPTKPDPCPSDLPTVCGGHGTSIGGLIAAEGWNNIGVRGIAPNASIFGANFLENQNGTEAQALGVNYPGGVTADIYNMSYGIGYETQYANAERMSEIELQTFTNGVNNLRDGKGAIYIKSAGNDYLTNTTGNLNAFQVYCGISDYAGLSCTEQHIDNQTTIPYVLTVAALNADGTRSSYSTPGPATWVSGFGGEGGYDATIYNKSGTDIETAMMTVDRSSCTLGYSRTGSDDYKGKNKFNLAGQNFLEQLTLNPDCNYTSHFNGTSSAAPTIAGVVALMLEANPDLTWRDVKHILASTAKKVDAGSGQALVSQTYNDWVLNAAGYEFNNIYGFGMVDAAEAVATAQTYLAGSLGDFVKSNREEKVWLEGDSQIITEGPGAYIPTGTAAVSLNVTKPDGSNGVVEFVRVSLQFQHDITPYLGWRLQSPSGTIHDLIQPLTNNVSNGDIYFDMGVSGFYGEDMEGPWSLIIDNLSSQGGIIYKWGIEVYGN